MGLDMYLKQKIFIGCLYDINIKVKDKIHDSFDLDNKVLKNVSEIELGAAYWRKAYCIHDYFVYTIQEGVDDCKTYEISGDKLKHLYDICLQIWKNEISYEESIDYIEDKYDDENRYREEILLTINQLKNIDFTKTYEYHGSW